ncbi:hypothetical protein DFR41_1011044 [Pseudacidovorax intermedius]|uniref:DUF4124 domain-containing protein n=1 Tax=Pseudacidovorax intermedius TaxID=433924 RepID=A0A370FU55_9BURK|nr:DUF4124 domain-containing protein [Pseudacidovorax intermedius]RDI29288.1 hypothetical protein DFR41_1011044 [Pseudacidovorax intermedius]
MPDPRSPAIARALRTLAGLASLAFGGLSQAQAPAAGSPGSIYTCTDASGRRLTSDRFIPECADRLQLELSPGGSVRRRIEPALSPQQQAERDQRRKDEERAEAQRRDERRRDLALVARYPDAAAHDRRRAEALAHAEAEIGAARKRLAELAEARRKLDGELEFYSKDPSPVPAALKARLAENTSAVALQERLLKEQVSERQRIDARFDEERQRLDQLWGVSRPAVPSRVR